MKPSRTAEVLRQLVETRWAAFVWGPPGVGKSSVVRQVGATLKRPVIDVRAALLDPTDIRGLPYVQEGVARWSRPSFLPGPEDKPGILFFDELSAAPPLVQASLYQLTLDRAVGEYRLPDGWAIVAAGNRTQDHSVAFRMPAALANRFVHLDFEVDFDDWRAWAMGSRIHPLVMAFLGMRRELLWQAPTDQRCFPTPRTWEMASDTLHRFGKAADAEDVLAGIVGPAACIEFMAFARNAKLLKVFESVLKDPAGTRLPTALDQRFALIGYVAAQLTQDEVVEAAVVLMKRFEPEFGLLLLRDVLRARPRLVGRSDVQEFVALHKASL